MTSPRALGLLGAGLGLALAVGMLTAPPGDASSLPAPAVAPAPAPSGVPLPTLSKPPDGVHGHPLWDSWHELRSFGYRQREYLVSGTARALDGSTAPYTTRIIVFRPRKESRSNGTVMLDWVNVTAQFENAVDTLEAREMLLREGWTFVHVSAQKAGLCCSPLTPQAYDPVRYASLNHPGDQYSADIFSQVARAMRAHRGLDPMKGLAVKQVIAAGQSQSADKLYDYITQWQAQAEVIDGFLIHGNGTVKKTFPAPLDVPVLNLLSDREAEPEKPTKDRNYRLWEVAATAHSDFFIGVQSVDGNGPRVADQPAADRERYAEIMDHAGNYGQVPDPLHATCTLAGATMPMHYATSTALHQLNRWVRTGKRPARTPRYQFDGTELAKDEHGNTLGGIRLPPVEVPVARYESTTCNLGGITVPFSDAQLQELYPTFDRYQLLMGRATDRAVRRGWLLPPDARDMMRRVCAVQPRYPAELRGTCTAATYDPPRFASNARP
ncbi:alpha/beta hydrolase domain-containing protein [Nocardioides dilutus]